MTVTPDWIAAGGTSGSLLLAMVILFREQSRRAREVASKVMPWVEANTFSADPVKRKLARVVVYNGSDSPVTNLLLRAESPDREPDDPLLAQYGMSPTDDYYDLRMVAVGSPDKEVSFPGLHPHERVWADIRILAPSAFYSFRLYFVDPNGRSWTKHLGSGKLKRGGLNPSRLARLRGAKAGIMVITPQQWNKGSAG